MSLDPKIMDAYHKWYADNVSRSISYLGVPIMKWVGDLWSYQEIIVAMKPSLIIEFGTACGGSALWFAELMRYVNPNGLVCTVDIRDGAHEPARKHPLVRCIISDTEDLALRDTLISMREEYPGTVFAIIDSDHTKAHVLAEMELLRSVLKTGDYLVVEDGNLNGHPIYPSWGEGPYEAIEEYMGKYLNDYELDTYRESRFGFTFAVKGYLVRQ